MKMWGYVLSLCAWVCVCVCWSISSLRSLVSTVINANYIFHILSMSLWDQYPLLETHTHAHSTGTVRLSIPYACLGPCLLLHHPLSFLPFQPCISISGETRSSTQLVPHSLFPPSPYYFSFCSLSLRPHMPSFSTVIFRTLFCIPVLHLHSSSLLKDSPLVLLKPLAFFLLRFFLFILLYIPLFIHYYLMFFFSFPHLIFSVSSSHLFPLPRILSSLPLLYLVYFAFSTPSFPFLFFKPI